MSITLRVDEELEHEIHIMGGTRADGDGTGEVTIWIPSDLLDGRAFAALGTALGKLHGPAFAWSPPSSVAQR
jgi:hypothetical protein